LDIHLRRKRGNLIFTASKSATKVSHSSSSGRIVSLRDVRKLPKSKFEIRKAVQFATATQRDKAKAG